MARLRAVVATVDLVVVLLGFLHGWAATSEVTEIDSVVAVGHVRAARRVYLVVAVGLSVLVDVVACHWVLRKV